VVGGLIGALGLNALSILRVRLERGVDGAAEALDLRFELAVGSLAIILFSTLLLGCIAAYVFVENFQPRVIN
jgi:hypothetical protein